MAVDDSYTKLLLHMDGADNGTTFTDESGKTVTAHGNVCTKQGTLLDVSGSKTYYDGGHYSVDVGGRAFNDSLSTQFQGNGAPDWCAVDLGAGNSKIVTSMRIIALVYRENAQLKDFILQGSNDSTNGADGTWTDLLSATHQNNTDWQSYSVTNSTAYRWYRIYVTSSYRTDATLAGIRECELFEGTISPLYKFGTASAYLDGNGDYLSLADSDDFNFGSGDFTIDTWLYIDSTISGSWPGIFAQRAGASYGISCFLMLENKKVRFEYSTNGTSATGTTFNTTLNTNQWYHLALVRNGATITCYINGVAEATTVNIGTSTIYNSSAAVIIGWLVGSFGVDCYLKGCIDEMRFSKGIARWTANFTPPTEEYGASAPASTRRRFAQII